MFTIWKCIWVDSYILYLQQMWSIKSVKKFVTFDSFRLEKFGVDEVL